MPRINTCKDEFISHKSQIIFIYHFSQGVIDITKKNLGPEVEFKDFTNGVALIKDSINNGVAKLYFEPARTGLVFKEPLVENFLDDYHIQVDSLQKISKEVIEILSIILSNERENVISNLEDNQSLIHAFKERCKIVNNELITWDLVKRFNLQKNYKTSLLDKFDWDIIIKHNKFRNKTLTFPTAMLRIRTRKPFSDNPPVIKTDTLTLEAGLEEIDSLINELTEIRTKLREEEKLGDENLF